MSTRSLSLLFLALLSLLRNAAATSVLLPLYIYPSDGTDPVVNWDPLFSTLSAHPGTAFTVVVDPDSGPGAGTHPDSNYIAGITRLHSFPNVRVVGYVHTTDATEPMSALRANVTKYANWASYTKGGANIAVQGIFLDEAPSDDSSASLQYMRDAAQMIRSAIPSAVVVYNPGTFTSAAYFSPVPPDFSIQFENYYSAYQGASTLQRFAPGEAARSALLLHDVPNANDVAPVVSQAKQAGIGAVWFTPDCCYGSLALLDATVSALESA